MYTYDVFIEAILSGDVEGVERCLDENVELELLDDYGFTPLIEATIANKSEIIAKLLAKGADVNSRDTTGRTALHWAVDNAHIPICELLLQYHADPNAYTEAGQPILVLPYLRAQKTLKNLLYRHKGQVSFAQDFVQVKLLGHRYELTGQADIIDPQGQFVAIDYEGFFLEFVIDIIRYSLERYCNHFMARTFREDFSSLRNIIQIFQRASRLLQYQKYTIDIEQISDQIDMLLDTELLLLPIAYEGHAISFIRYKNLLVRCDRGENSEREGAIVVYRMKEPARWTNSFVKQLFYQKQSYEFITQGIVSSLGLQRLSTIPIKAQRVGNCSWANVEASVLVLLYLLKWKDQSEDYFLNHPAIQGDCHTLYDHWLQWDKTRALDESLKSFQHASAARKATTAMLLGAVLFQSCRYDNDHDVAVARKLVPILMVSEYQYILKSYLKVYWHDKKTEEGHNLRQLLNVCGVNLPSQ